MNTILLPTVPNLTQSAVEQVLIADWKKLLSAKHLSIHDNFFERGGNALLALEAIATVNKSFRRHLTLSTIFDYPTIESLADALVTKKRFATKSLVELKKGGGKTPIYIVTYMGGSVDRFCKFAYTLDKDQPVYGLQTPLDPDDFAGENFSMEEMAADYIQNEALRYVSLLLEQNPDGPFALAGYSFGGFIAREMTTLLQAKGKNVVLLAMLDTIMPGTKKTLPPESEAKALRGLAKMDYQLKLLRQNFSIAVYDTTFLLKKDSKKWVIRQLQLGKECFVGGKPKAKAEKSQRTKALTKNRKELAIAAKKAYPLDYYDGEIVLFRARKRSSYYVSDSFLGWRPFCQSIKVYKIDGDHVSIFNPYYNRRLAKQLQQVLDQCALIHNSRSQE